jgi:23S rRNA pseudouridine1911/1915/1917 synthase
VDKRYLAIVKNRPQEIEAELVHYLVRNEQKNRSFAYNKEVPGSKKSILKYRLVGSSTNYNLLEIELMTGRHHQIRCQLSKMGMPIKGDLKYGAERSNPDGGISLHAYYICFEHPVSHKQICVSAPLPDDNLWRSFTAQAQALLPEGCL